jgi:hypothetical protein
MSRALHRLFLDRLLPRNWYVIGVIVYVYMYHNNSHNYTKYTH